MIICFIRISHEKQTNPPPHHCTTNAFPIEFRMTIRANSIAIDNHHLSCHQNHPFLSTTNHPKNTHPPALSHSCAHPHTSAHTRTHAHHSARAATTTSHHHQPLPAATEHVYNPPCVGIIGFQCASPPFVCIPRPHRCDGLFDCADHSDEHNCTTVDHFSEHAAPLGRLRSVGHQQRTKKNHMDAAVFDAAPAVVPSAQLIGLLSHSHSHTPTHTHTHARTSASAIQPPHIEHETVSHTLPSSKLRSPMFLASLELCYNGFILFFLFRRRPVRQICTFFFVVESTCASCNHNNYV